MSKVKIGVLVSGGGSNLQAILDAAKSGRLANAEVAVVVSNKAEAFALERAQKEGVPGVFLDPKAYPSRADFFEAVIRELESRSVELVCLAGFLLKLESNIVRRFHRRILNIHPALLPKYGGKGMYGHFVHEAVVKAGEKESGCTVHVVDDEYDHGPIVLQRRVPVLPGDTAEALAERILKEERLLYPEAIALFLKADHQDMDQAHDRS